jgi:hypothetical protein
MGATPAFGMDAFRMPARYEKLLPDGLSFTFVQAEVIIVRGS